MLMVHHRMLAQCPLIGKCRVTRGARHRLRLVYPMDVRAEGVLGPELLGTLGTRVARVHVVALNVIAQVGLRRVGVVAHATSPDQAAATLLAVLLREVGHHLLHRRCNAIGG